MGKKGSRPLQQHKAKQEKITPMPRSDSYSDDYRLTPDFLLQENISYCNGVGCCSRRRSCPDGEFCCSRETCVSPSTKFLGRHHIRRSSPSLSPHRRSPTKDIMKEAAHHNGIRRQKKPDMEFIVYNDKHLNLHKKASSCSSCSSCDSCYSGNSSYTKIELRNNLFTSPLQSTDASFYQAPCGPQSLHCARDSSRSPFKYSKGNEERLHHSPRRRVGSYVGDLKYVGNDPSFSRKDILDERNVRRGVTRRARSFNGGTSFLEETEKSSPKENGVKKELKSRSEISDEDLQQKRKFRNGTRDQTGSHSPPTRASKTSDSGLGRSYRTSGSSGIGGSVTQSNRNGGSGDSDERKVKKEEKRNKEERRNEDKGVDLERGSKNVTKSKQVDLLHKMVSQTREHRKQIKTLESELERLRATGDALSSCEVNQRDVEWRPGDVVGEGSFSTVYKGAYCGTEVAVKELKCKLSQDDKNYFRSEAALLQQLHHPRVVLLMGVCTSAARPFMLLEYLAGGTLHTLIHTTTRERIDHAAYFVIAKDVAQGINYLHRHDPQVLHLDLKSMNVLLDGYTRAKIADFGFSILRRSRGGSAVERGAIRGTPAWMAPELLTKGDVSPKCDVYSYAIILWEMLTASHPFQGLDIYHIMEAVEDGVRPPLPVSGVSSELRELITSCWAQNPSLRPSFEEVLGALETASLPSSWRKLLTRASITPSSLSDVATARAIIGMINRSAELLERSNHTRPSRSEIKSETKDDREMSRSSRKPLKQDTIPSRSNSRGRLLSPKGRRNRPPSASRDSRIRSRNRDIESSVFEKSERKSSLKEYSSPKREKRSSEGRIFSPTRRENLRSEKENTRKASTKNRQSRESGSSRPQSPRKDDRGRSQSPSKGRNSGAQERKSRYRRTQSNHRSLTRSEKINVEYTTEDSNLSDGRSSISGEDNGIDTCASTDEERLVKGRDESAYSDDGSDGMHHQRISPASFKKSSGRSSPRRSPTRALIKPQRWRSPTRNRSNYSKGKQENDHKRYDGGFPQKYGGMILTAEQLLNQKQRLRPVRPSALKDLSLLPQSSLNDITFILKQAMSQRRDALQQLQSGRETIHSEDISWADLF